VLSSSLLDATYIDVAGLRSPYLNDRKSVAQEIRTACEQHGFFYVRNHGIPRPLFARTDAVARRFFALPRPLSAPSA